MNSFIYLAVCYINKKTVFFFIGQISFPNKDFFTFRTNITTLLDDAEGDW